MVRNSKNSISMLAAYEEGWRVRLGIIYNKNNDVIEISNASTDYLRVSKNFLGVRGYVYVHQLVAYQKFGEEVFDKTYKVHVRHKDGNKLNNMEENILIGTPSENMNDKAEDIRKTQAILASKYLRRFTDEEVDDILRDRKNGLSYRELGLKYNVGKGMLSYLFNHSLYAKK